MPPLLVGNQVSGSTLPVNGLRIPSGNLRTQLRKFGEGVGLALVRDVERQRRERAEVEHVLLPVVVGLSLEIVEERALKREDHRLRQGARVHVAVVGLAAGLRVRRLDVAARGTEHIEHVGHG